MEVVLNRKEIDEALQCFMAKRGYVFQTMNTTISAKQATLSIDLDEEKENNENSFENNSEAQIPEGINLGSGLETNFGG